MMHEGQRKNPLCEHCWSIVAAVYIGLLAADLLDVLGVLVGNAGTNTKHTQRPEL
jgi:hypothetical protein